MKNKGKTKRLMWMTTAACAMMFLGMGVCLICGLRAARESIEESSKRDMEGAARKAVCHAAEHIGRADGDHGALSLFAGAPGD